jgi:hypothetical protein
MLGVPPGRGGSDTGRGGWTTGRGTVAAGAGSPTVCARFSLSLADPRSLPIEPFDWLGAEHSADRARTARGAQRELALGT